MTNLEETPDPLLGIEVDGRFRLEELLGQGGMGRVYRATQLSVDRPVAVKLIRDEHADNPLARRRFFREAKSVASFSHPSIVRLIEFGEDAGAGVLYLAMDYVDGEALSHVMSLGKFRHETALRLAAQIAEGLAEAHAAGVVHRDLKPDNVMLSRSAGGQVQPLILDFGVALPQGSSIRLTEDGRVCGTPVYMAPEQARAVQVGPAADTYALGVMLFEALTGVLPVVGPTPMSTMLKKLQEPAPDLRDVLAEGVRPPEPVGDLVRDLLERDPTRRLGSAMEFVDRVRDILGTGDFSLRLDAEDEYRSWLLEVSQRDVALVPTLAGAPPGSRTESGTPLHADRPASVQQAGHFVTQQRWREAVEAFQLTAPTQPSEFEEYGVALYMLGREDEFVEAFGRAHESYLSASEHTKAVRCAILNGLTLAFRGEMPLAGAWFKRAGRAAAGVPDNSVAQGYLLLPQIHMTQSKGDFAGALELAARAAAVAEAGGDEVLAALARHLEGKLHLSQGELAEGLAVLDEVMLSVTSERLPPMVTGLLYCSVIAGCQGVLALGRAHQWTRALSGWCETQPSLVAFTGKCLVHRAEVMRVSGEWDRALEEADLARQRFRSQPTQGPEGNAWYERGEVHRLRGELEEAEDAFRRASDLGREPQPGLALLRVAQGQPDKALGTIRRLTASTRPSERPRVLAAAVEILLAAGELDEAVEASAELTEMAHGPGREVVAAMARYAQATVELARGDAAAALHQIHDALELWREVGAPFELARCRLLKARACAALNDVDGTGLEIRAARSEFDRLGAVLPPEAQKLADQLP